MSEHFAAKRILALLSAAALLAALPACRREENPVVESASSSPAAGSEEPAPLSSAEESPAPEPSHAPSSTVPPAVSSQIPDVSAAVPSQNPPPEESQAPSEPEPPQSSSSSEPPVETRPTTAAYKKVNGISLFLDYYPPLSTTAEESPLLLYFHDGDWSSGSRQPAEPFLTLFRAFREQGYAVASADYRLLGDPDVGLDEMLQDTSDAVRYLICHADWFKIDPGRIALIGQGAGAHLALMTGFFPERYTESSPYPETPAQVGCIVTLGAPTDLIAAAQDDAFPLKQAVEALLGAPYDENNEEVKARYEAASPFQTLHDGIPPLFLIYGGNDAKVPTSQTVAFHNEGIDTLKDPSRIKMYPVSNAGHTLEPTNGAEINPTMEEITDAVLDFVHAKLFK